MAFALNISKSIGLWGLLLVLVYLLLSDRLIEIRKTVYKPSNILGRNKGIDISQNKTDVHTILTRIGILIPSSTRNIKNPQLRNLSLTQICLPSIYKTLQPGYEYNIYIGINRGDYIENVSQTLKKMFDRIQVVVTTMKTFTKTVNGIARKAYADGMEYMVRINDDTSFQSQNWTSAGIEVLRSYKPPNVGVVGPVCHEGNTKILTHDMVHRTHLDIFDYYYPTFFDNWWADDWITRVYEPGRSTRLKNWFVKHHLGTHTTRYSVDFKKKNRLETTITYDRQRMNEFCSNLKH